MQLGGSIFKLAKRTCVSTTFLAGPGLNHKHGSFVAVFIVFEAESHFLESAAIACPGADLMATYEVNSTTAELDFLHLWKILHVEKEEQCRETSLALRCVVFSCVVLCCIALPCSVLCCVALSCLVFVVSCLQR